jgi:hypothetical protein
MKLRMRAMRAGCEDQRRREVVKKILPKGESTGQPFAALGAERLSDQSAWLASARWQLVQATEGEAPDNVGACAGERENNRLRQPLRTGGWRGFGRAGDRAEPPSFSRFAKSGEITPRQPAATRSAGQSTTEA